jgi:hypothetical protein
MSLWSCWVLRNLAVVACIIPKMVLPWSRSVYCWSSFQTNRGNVAPSPFRLNRFTSGSDEQFFIQKRVDLALVAEDVAKVSLMLKEEMKRVSWNWRNRK